MKALPLLLLALLLGAGVAFLLIDSGDAARGTREVRPVAARSAPVEPEEAEEPPPGTAEVIRPGPEAAQRESVDVARAPELKITYEGTIIGDGAPLPGADVELLRHDEPVGTAQSDERGRFRLSLPARKEALLLRVRARGFVPVERNLPAKPAGGTELLGNLRLLRGARVTGRVVDGRGNGIPGAEVMIEPVSAGGDVLRARTLSGPDGVFEIPDAPPGSVLVRARARGFGERTVDHAGGREPKPLEIRLEPGAEMRFLLVTVRGDPVVGAELTITATDGASRTPPRTAKSDERGRVVFEGLGTPAWNVRVTHPDYRPDGRSQVKANGGEVTFTCQPWPAIEGVVLSPDGTAPPPGTRVHALPASAPGDRLNQVLGGKEVEADGRFRVSGLRQGDWTVRVTAPGYAPTTSQVVRLGIEGDGWAGSIRLAAGGRLMLLLTTNGKPLPGAEVEVVPVKPAPAQLFALRDSRGPGARARAGPDGKVELTDLAPGELWVLVFAEGCPPVPAGPFSVSPDPAGRPQAIDVPRGARLRGRVLEEGAAPAAEAGLRITERDGRLGFPMTLVADDQGRYTTVWLPAGHYSVEAFSSADPTRRSGAKELELAPGEQRELDLSL